MRGRIVRLLAVTLLAVTACSSPSDTTDRQSDPPPEEIEHVELPQVAAGPREDGPSALDNMRDQRLPRPLLDPWKILSGGPPPDGIPPIDEPRFSRANTVGWLTDTEPLLSLTVGDETRGYPLQIMPWHEIVNDTVDGVPVAVTYCPLCNSGVAFDRRATGRVLSFGTSGRLYADNLVMYDRQTESLWPQLTGQAALGVLTGTTLRAIPMGTVAWRDFRAVHSEAWVLTRDTGHRRPYGRNPYAGYDNPSGGLLFELPSTDARLPVKERVVGVSRGHDAVAVVRSAIARTGVLEVTVEGKHLIMWHRPGQASALDDERIVRGRDVGTVAVFDPVVKGRRLHFIAVGNGFRDRETDSQWTVLGQATTGLLKGQRLVPHQHLDTFWFAWVAFHPETRVIG
ncbi:uncharacterized protein DUF3179 [Kribbella sp. VKM Ac-2527]|uniref:Uncharacterized protein DUF3179 n=1 Tax=Kribbella caucasensis TaxID=2512215 RepID=A0A4V6PSM3_9ACTN|nr:DUF3179 domain-containing protein [Kribbella sp. VKM Ac-2527]TDO30428.1 uncharacterized protein DUF3179 [Kribbella sp. VKM Ac-2527]